MQLEPLEKRIRVEGVKTGGSPRSTCPGRIQQALAAGIISETEAAALRDYDRKVMDLINVDDFDPHELGTQAQRRPPRSQRARRMSTPARRSPAPTPQAPAAPAAASPALASPQQRARTAAPR